jgi:polar amino acid transport system substrate-binding protein
MLFIVNGLMLTLFLLTTNIVLAKERLVVAAADYEPWTVVEKKHISGIDVELINMLAAKLGIEVSYYPCPWARCLKLAEQGDIDLISNAFKTSERQKYLSYLEPAYINGTYRVFYLNNASDIEITRLEDLHELDIGVRPNVKYFEQFDLNTSLKKVTIMQEEQLIGLLLKERIDVFIGQEDVIDYVLRKNNLSSQVKKAKYRVLVQNKGFMALSKKSKLLYLKPQLENTLQELIRDEVLTTIKLGYQ